MLYINLNVKIPCKKSCLFTILQIYNGKVANIMQYGCFVQILGTQTQQDGLVHISQLQREGRTNDVNDVVAKGQAVKVKVLSMVGKKISLSIKVRSAEFYFFVLFTRFFL